KVWYTKYTTTKDARNKWYRMGEASEEANASYYYKTSTDPLFGTTVDNVNSAVAYYVQTQCKPNIKESIIKTDPGTGAAMKDYDTASSSGATALSSRNLPYYIIVVKEYQSEEEALRALNGELIAPLYCRTKNVTVKRNTDLEIMD
ncbi:MAG: hypothetical protein K6C69_02950, partial [Lachnospiraceae bacterium]|nr:hypothetical protein [Lachnospiraceae bacterium]